jgi:hypothetical protein
MGTSAFDSAILRSPVLVCGRISCRPLTLTTYFPATCVVYQKEGIKAGDLCFFELWTLRPQLVSPDHLLHQPQAVVIESIADLLIPQPASVT